MKTLGYLSVLAAAGALGAAVILACSNPAVSITPAVPKPPESTPPQGVLTLVYGTNNRIEVTRGSPLTVTPTLPPRAAKDEVQCRRCPQLAQHPPRLRCNFSRRPADTRGIQLRRPPRG